MADSFIADEVSPLIFRSSQSPLKTDNRTPFQRKLAIWIILLAVGFERLAFYSLGGNLVLFLTSDTIQWSAVHSVTGSLYFFGASYVSALMFSWISDGKLGRAKTILIGFVLYVTGYVFMPLFARKEIFHELCYNEPNRTSEAISYWRETCSGQITTALIITGVGVGAVQSNMAIFGAEQVRDQRGTTEYFDKYYVAINVGGLLAFGILSYIHLNTQWFIGHITATALLGVAVLLFLLGFPFYYHVKPYDSVVTNFIPVIINAYRTRRKQRDHARRISFERRTNQKSRDSIDYDDRDDHVSYEINERPQSFFDYAKVGNNGKYSDRVVDEIKALRPVIVLFLLLIPYWMIYLQTDTTFIIQGVHMFIPALNVSSHNHHTMPLLWLSLADQVVIILAIFILNTCVYKRLQATNRRLSMRSRLVIGMIAAAISISIAGVVEIFRQEHCDRPYSTRNQEIGRTTYTAADMSVFIQFPQYVAMGLSEVFTSVASLEFAYLAAPQSAQSFVMSLRFSTTGLSSLISSGYVNIYQLINKNFTIHNLECKNKSNPQLFYIYFFVLAIIQLVFIFIFLLCDHKFQILKASERRFNTRLFMVSSSRRSNT